MPAALILNPRRVAYYSMTCLLHEPHVQCGVERSVGTFPGAHGCVGSHRWLCTPGHMGCPSLHSFGGGSGSAGRAVSPLACLSCVPPIGSSDLLLGRPACGFCHQLLPGVLAPGIRTCRTLLLECHALWPGSASSVLPSQCRPWQAPCPGRLRACAGTPTGSGKCSVGSLPTGLAVTAVLAGLGAALWGQLLAAGAMVCTLGMAHGSTARGTQQGFPSEEASVSACGSQWAELPVELGWLPPKPRPGPQGGVEPGARG